MNYNELDKYISSNNIKKIIITGPQRSGTRFMTSILSDDMGYKYIDESEFDIWSYEKLKSITMGIDGFVAHAPGLAHLVNEIDNDIFIVFMRRDVADIVNSQNRINWGEIEINYIKDIYRNKFKNHTIDFTKPISEIKYQVWDIEKLNILNKYVDFNYTDLKLHKRWVDKDKRTGFNPHQVSL